MDGARCPGCNLGGAAAGAPCTRCGGTLVSTDAERASTVDGVLLALARAPAHLPGPASATGLLLEDRYLVGEFIDRGGMGDVHAGTDTKLRRKVAIKFLAVRLQHEPLAVERFVREAQFAASLDHPNIVPVYSVGEVAKTPYMVMRFIDGETVTTRIRREGRLPVEDAVRLVAHACDGLTPIHAAGYVHRDIKPQNLMVERGRCIILDFGILRAVDGSGTTTGLFLGTPAYMSPEQARDPRAADARSDLYALAVSFFEMVTGSLPFKASSPLDLLFKHRAEHPAAPSTLVASLSPALDALVARGLAKAPEDRFQPAAEMKAALLSRRDTSRGAPASQPSTRDEGTTLEPLVVSRSSFPSAPPLRSRWRRAVVVAAASAALAALVLVAIWWTREQPLARRGESLPQATTAAAKVEESIAANARTAPATDSPPSAQPDAGAAPAPSAPEVSKANLRAVQKHKARARAPARPKSIPRARASAPPGAAAASAPVASPTAVAPASKGEPPAAPSSPAPPATGRVRIIILHENRGTWASLSVDGELIGELRTTTRELTRGRHRFVARREGYDDAEVTAAVEPGAAADIKLHLRRKRTGP